MLGIKETKWHVNEQMSDTRNNLQFQRILLVLLIIRFWAEVQRKPRFAKSGGSKKIAT